MPIKLYGFTASHNVQKVMWACAELDLDFERLEIAGKAGGTDTAQFLAMNPNRRVPVIEDGELVLWESHAILRYLAATYGVGTLWPEDPRIRARADRWMDWHLTISGPSLQPVYNALIRTPAAERDAAAVEEGRRKLVDIFAILDGYLAGSEFVGGTEFSMGDIPVGIATWRWFNLPLDRPDLPHLARWFARLKERPGYQAYIMKDLA